MKETRKGGNLNRSNENYKQVTVNVTSLNKLAVQDSSHSTCRVQLALPHAVRQSKNTAA